uniref:(California timema) hypothetical protein n=1 Tax=Timema californicum TaxID=61474 RepID=A0A7R9JBW6_TIMCA|nr:unnamed protein product [Timema californicum]
MYLGVLWGLATIMHIYPEVKLPYVKGEPLDSNVTSYKMMYSDHLPNELTAMGIISFCLTIINIACIFITALIVLKIKEVAAPYTSSPDLRRFWEYDIRMARENNRSSSMQSSGAHGANKQAVGPTGQTNSEFIIISTYTDSMQSSGAQGANKQ